MALSDYLRLARVSLAPTAAADVCAGYLIAAPALRADERGWRLGWAAAASLLLYAAGMVLNDYFDRERDRVRHPRRPIPSGRVSPGAAFALAVTLSFAAFLLASFAGEPPFLVSLALALAILLYDGLAKEVAFVGPLAMGLCRGLNLGMGLACWPEQWRANFLAYAALAVLYIALVTHLSQQEEGATSHEPIRVMRLRLALLLAPSVGLAIFQPWAPVPFVALLLLALRKARALERGPAGPRAVQGLVFTLLCLIPLLDAGLVAASGHVLRAPEVLLVYVPFGMALFLSRLAPPP